MLCDRALEAAWGAVELDAFTERHVRWCGQCRAHHPQHESLRVTLVELRTAMVERDHDRLEELFRALDRVDARRRQRTYAACAAAAGAALVVGARARRLATS